MAININRVYTRGGDGGKTSLVGGARVDKDCLKLESYGTVDELICLVGTARTVIAAPEPRGSLGAKKPAPGLPPAIREDLGKGLRLVQNRLFDAGSILATPDGASYSGMPEITDADAAYLEREMDRMQAFLEPLTSFVLPGGTLANAALHECRAVCRRAEREILRLSREERIDPRLIKYINRLSDYFFVVARYAARMAGAAEYLWEYGAAADKGGHGKKGGARKPAAARDNASSAPAVRSGKETPARRSRKG